MTYVSEGIKFIEYTSWQAWKRAVKKRDPEATIIGDKDIADVQGNDFYGQFEWENGTIEIDLSQVN